MKYKHILVRSLNWFYIAPNIVYWVVKFKTNQSSNRSIHLSGGVLRVAVLRRTAAPNIPPQT